MKNGKNGFTFFELLIVLVIMGIVFSFALPGWKSFLTHSDSSALRQQLFNAIQLARNEAITQHTIITLCGTHDFKTCASDWNEGFVILDQYQVLHVFQSFSKSGSLTFHAFPHHTNQLLFSEEGTSYFENGTFQFFLRGSKEPDWSIIINQAGRARCLVAR